MANPEALSDSPSEAGEGRREEPIVPGLSIIVPAHNEELELPKTLAAIKASIAAMADPVEFFELIVVDDSSTDRTALVAEAGGARVVRSNARQIAGTRNVGAKAASREWLLFVDADTRISASVLSGILAALRSGAVGGGAEVRWEPPTPLWGHIYLFLFMLIWRRLGHAAGCCLFCRRRDFEAVGGFDQRFYAAEEIGLSKALRARGTFTLIRHPVLTSGRKVRLTSALGMLATSMKLLIRGPRGWQQREGLELWYDPRMRETHGDRQGGADRPGP